MPRKRKIEYGTDSLPSEMELVLGIVFFTVWLGASIAYYWGVLGEIERLLAALAPWGVKPDDSAFRPILDMAIRLAPLVGLPVAFRAWSWTRRVILRALSGAF